MYIHSPTRSIVLSFVYRRKEKRLEATTAFSLRYPLRNCSLAPAAAAAWVISFAVQILIRGKKDTALKQTTTIESQVRNPS